MNAKRLLAAVCLLAFELPAQFVTSSTQSMIRGRLAIDSGTLESYGVAVYSLQNSLCLQQAVTTLTGDFEFPGISNGDYRLVVTDHSGRQIKQELVHLSADGIIEVRLPELNKPAIGVGGVVTLNQLSHKAPRKALHELAAAAKAREKGDSQASLAHLLAAVSIDPEYAAAHGDLGAQYLDLKLDSQALPQLERAIKLDPASAVYQLNKAMCLDRLGNVPQAEAAARLAVQLDPTSQKSHFALGVLLARQSKLTDEAVTHLLQASSAFPGARLAAAQILASMGKRAEAKVALHQYLEICAGSECDSAQCLLTKLTR